MKTNTPFNAEKRAGNRKNVLWATAHHFPAYQITMLSSVELQKRASPEASWHRREGRAHLASVPAAFRPAGG